MAYTREQLISLMRKLATGRREFCVSADRSANESCAHNAKLIRSLIAEKLSEADQLDAIAAMLEAGGKPVGVLVDVTAERQRQDTQWGGPTTDDTREDYEWIGFIGHQMDRFKNQFMVVPFVPPREVFIKIAALAVAAVESIDRKAKRGEGQ